MPAPEQPPPVYTVSTGNVDVISSPVYTISTHNADVIPSPMYTVPTESIGAPSPPVNAVHMGSADVTPPPYSNIANVAPPPSYESLFGRVQVARKESSGICDFVKKLRLAVGCYLLMGVLFLFALPALKVIIGCVYLGQCRREKFIPVYLVTAGGMELMWAFCLVLVKKYAKDAKSGTWDFPQFGFCLFYIGWFIAGNFSIYGTYKNFDGWDLSSPEYCHPVLLWSAFWIMNATYATFAMMIIFSCCR